MNNVCLVTEHDCKTCEPVLEKLENIDDEAEAAGNLDKNRYNFINLHLLKDMVLTLFFA